jgi:biopolymer transport protein ExbD
MAMKQAYSVLEGLARGAGWRRIGRWLSKAECRASRFSTERKLLRLGGRNGRREQRELFRGPRVGTLAEVAMAGIEVGVGGRAKRRSLDSEVNMIPMIDLLMVTISFLLITAVWTHMARINADARVPGRDTDAKKAEPEKQLHVEMHSPDKFVLAWKQGGVTVDSVDLPRKDVVIEQGGVTVVRFPSLAAKVESEWKAKGQHGSPTDRQLDQAVLHTDDKTEFKYIIGVIDAIYQAHRDIKLGAKVERVPAFNIAFAMN